MFAVRNGHTDVVEALAKGGADLKLTNADGATATIVAIVNDRFDLAKELLDLGADPNDGSLYFAVDMHDATTVDMRAHDGSRLQPSHPNKMTSLSLVKSLLDLNADVEQAVYRRAALYDAVLRGIRQQLAVLPRLANAADVEVLKLMLAHSAKIEMEPERGQTQGRQRSWPGESERRPHAPDGRYQRRSGRTDRRGPRFHPHWSAAIPQETWQPRSARGSQASPTAAGADA